MTAQHQLQPYWDLAASGIRAEALRLALEAGVFIRLQQPLTGRELAERLGWVRVNTEYLLELLWSMALLQRQRHPHCPEFRYCVNALSRRYWCEGEFRCTESWLFRHQALRQTAAGLESHLCSPPPARTPPLASGQDWARAARRQLAQEQRTVSAPAAITLSSAIPEFATARTLLDLGGGPGLIAIALALHHAQLGITLFEWPETAAVARENIAAAGLQQRIGTRGGDLNQAALGQDYDIIWGSSVLHFATDPLQLLRRVHDALAPGGVFISLHAERSPQAETDARVLPYYLPLLLAGRFVPTAGELEALLHQAGFDTVTQAGHHEFALVPLNVLLARKRP